MTSRISSPLPLQRRTFLASAASVAAAVAAPALTHAAGPAIQAATLPDFGAAPEFTGIERWLNSEPLTLAQLRGRVVLVDFWTYACINCIRTLPHVNRWAELYTPWALRWWACTRRSFRLSAPPAMSR